MSKASIEGTHQIATDDIPEPPQHELHITDDGENTLRYVNSDHPEVWEGLAHRNHCIVRCGICGHETHEWGTMRCHVWMGHEDHFSRRHVGVKVIWTPDDVVDKSIAELSQLSRRRYSTDDDDPEPLHVFRGDADDAYIPERDDESVIVVHQPPREPYPGSPEEDATEAIYVA